MGSRVEPGVHAMALKKKGFTRTRSKISLVSRGRNRGDSQGSRNEKGRVQPKKRGSNEKKKRGSYVAPLKRPNAVRVRETASRTPKKSRAWGSRNKRKRRAVLAEKREKLSNS